MVDYGTRWVTSLSDPDVSWESIHDIAAHSPLQRDQLRTFIHLERGDVVTLLVKDARFQIRTMGMVQEVIDHGRSVLVENMDSKRTVVGKPISKHEVQIVF